MDAQHQDLLDAAASLEHGRGEVAGGGVDTVLLQALMLMGEADHLGLVVLSGRGTGTVGATSAATRRCERLQQALRQGPGIEAVRRRGWARSGEVRGDLRWPAWGPRAAEAGVGSVLSVGMVTGAGGAASLTAYSRSAGLLTQPDSLESGLLCGVHAAYLLDHYHLVPGLRVAGGASERHLVDLAVGVLMEAHRVGPDQAMALLRRSCRLTATRLVQVAGHVVDHRRLPGANGA